MINLTGLIRTKNVIDPVNPVKKNKKMISKEKSSEFLYVNSLYGRKNSGADN